jgi:hypothetical protein
MKDEGYRGAKETGCSSAWNPTTQVVIQLKFNPVRLYGRPLNADGHT